MIIQEESLLLTKERSYIAAVECVGEDFHFWNGKEYIKRDVKYAGTDELISIAFGDDVIWVYRNTRFIQCFIDQEDCDYQKIQTLLASFFYKLPIECQYDCFQEFARENKDYFKMIRAKDIKEGDYLLSCKFDKYSNPLRQQGFSMVKYVNYKSLEKTDCVKIVGDDLSIITCQGLFLSD